MKLTAERLDGFGSERTIQQDLPCIITMRNDAKLGNAILKSSTLHSLANITQPANVLEEMTPAACRRVLPVYIDHVVRGPYGRTLTCGDTFGGCNRRLPEWSRYRKVSQSSAPNFGVSGFGIDLLVPERSRHREASPCRVRPGHGAQFTLFRACEDLRFVFVCAAVAGCSLRAGVAVDVVRRAGATASVHAGGCCRKVVRATVLKRGAAVEVVALVTQLGEKLVVLFPFARMPVRV
jgi:hypothetical protein